MLVILKKKKIILLFLQSLETLDNGKTFAASYTVDVPLSWEWIRYYAGWSDKVVGQTIPVGKKHLCEKYHVKQVEYY